MYFIELYLLKIFFQEFPFSPAGVELSVEINNNN